MVHKGKKAYLKTQQNESAEVEDKNCKTNKKAKIIVRNLPFKNLSEKKVENFFKEYGDILEVNLLKKEDGSFVGCGFIQFSKVSSAAKAIRYGNEKEMNGRKIVVDWALPKKTFLEKVQQLKENIHGTTSDLEVQSNGNIVSFDIDKKPDVINNEEEENFETESESESESESDSDMDESNVKIKEENEDSVEDDDSDDYDDNINKKINGIDKKTVGKSNKQSEKLPTQKTDDLEDGKTVFIRNIPFSAENKDLEESFKSYGPIIYALICIDKITEHSKGTGFVKFKDKESASRCIKDSGKIFLHDNPLTVTTAISKNDLQNKKQSTKTVRDSRNLYLIREGMIIAGSKAAAGVSAGDMSKRLQLEQWKNQILKDLNMFVSKTRLVIHNLPLDYDDFKLRNLFMKYSDPKAVIKEAKVMYDRKKVDSTGKNVSKEVGFVTFTKHEDALKALRNINNNPEIFTPKKRPIVAFSIENKAVINSKIKRLEKSRAKLGLSTDKPDKLSTLNRKQRRFLKRREKFIERRKEKKKQKQEQQSDNQENTNLKRMRKNTEDVKPSKKQKLNTSQDGEEPVPKAYTGVISESGKKIKLRSKFRLKNQANIHSQTLKEERQKRKEKQKKSLKSFKPSKKNKIVNKSKLMDDAELSKLLKKHRESIQQSSIIKKWYDK